MLIDTIVTLIYQGLCVTYIELNPTVQLVSKMIPWSTSLSPTIPLVFHDLTSLVDN